MRLYARHQRFLTAFVVGLAIGGASLLLPLSTVVRTMLAADGFFIAYLGLMALFISRAGPEDLRRHAELSDEGLPLILLLALGAVAVSLTSIFAILNPPEGAGRLDIILALASVPLGWAMLHTLAAFHYALLFYTADDGSGGKDRGGLDFPGTDQPTSWDFLYFAFVLGMTAQTADVTVRRTDLRQAVLAHSVASFFYNAVILALTVNAALALGG